MFNTEYVLKNLKKQMGIDLFELLVELDAMLVGGALTSILTNKDINDFDIYFKKKADLCKFLHEAKYEVAGGQYRFICNTDKSVTFSLQGSDITLQLIHQNYYKNIDKVFEDFDFTINMVGYDFGEDEFVYHEEAMQHLAQRKLIVNTNTKFPLISVLRVQKYLDRGYSISKKEMLRLLLSISQLNLTSYDDVIKQLGGMYSVNMDKVFDKNVMFSMDNVIDQLTSYDFDQNQEFCVPDYDKFVFDFTFSEDLGFLKTLPFFKGVIRQPDGSLISQWDKDFKYFIGEKAIPNTLKSYNGYGDPCGIYATHNPTCVCHGDTLISLSGIEDFDGSKFKYGAIVKHVVAEDYKNKSDTEIMTIILDYLESFGYIEDHQRGIVEMYYSQSQELDFAGNKDSLPNILDIL